MTSSAKREDSDYQPIPAQSITATDGSLGAASGLSQAANPRPLLIGVAS
jgi:hypothetical protein